MSKKVFTVITAYALAIIAVLGIYSYISYKNLAAYRQSSRYASMLAFEETVSAVDRMSATLAKSMYATDGAMCSKICSQVYADAMAAEAALSTLPFATHELEEICGYLNQVGDYAYTLCSTAAQNGFEKEDVENLTELSGVASGLAQSLRELQGSVHEGSILMDRRERELINVGRNKDSGNVSDEFLRFESEFPHRSSLRYDGRYSRQDEDEAVQSKLSDAEVLAQAARFAGLSPTELKLSYEYEGGDGRKCYTAGEMRICVDKTGVESMSQSRIVEDSRISLEKAEEIASAFLEKQGYSSLRLSEKEEQGALARFKFTAMQNDVELSDRYVSLAVALDDGSIYFFSRENYDSSKVDAYWGITQQQAEDTLPESLTLTDSAKVVIESEGGTETACYRLRCTNGENEPVTIYVDASSGRQSRIEL